MATSLHPKQDHTENALLTADKIKKATFNVAKGLCRFQVDRAAAAAARNVNAYGQKEEGPSRWQERKEAKRQMYLMSTEKAVKLGVRKDNKVMTNCFGGGVQCQRCFGAGHWTFECKNERVYVSRPSQTQQLHNPALRQNLLGSCDTSTTSKTKLEVEVKQSYRSNMFITVEESKGSKSKQDPPRKSDFRNRKRRRSKGSSSTSSSEESPSKSSSDSEEPPSLSEESTSTTHTSSTFSSPSRTTSSSRKSSSCSSTNPPTPESESEDRPNLSQRADTESECQMTSLSFCKNDK